VKFKWKEGYEMEFTPLHKICGIQKGGRRPSSVEFTSEDAKVILDAEKNKVHRWLLHVSQALRILIEEEI
jgi:hypothetical protein